MKNDKQTSDSKLLTRREAAKIAGVTLATGTLFSTMAFGEPTAAGPSVFEDNCIPTSGAKYASGDKDVIYGLVAVWLMLTTDDWSSCLKDPVWRKKLATELGVDPTHIETLYQISMDHSDVLQKSQIAFKGFVKSLNVYGHPPCPGGKTISQIANLNLQSATKMKPSTK
jgi:hypothetical protein